MSRKLSIYWLNLSQKSLKLVEFWASRAMQYNIEPKSIFPKPRSPIRMKMALRHMINSCYEFLYDAIFSNILVLFASQLSLQVV